MRLFLRYVTSFCYGYGMAGVLMGKVGLDVKIALGIVGLDMLFTPVEI